MSRLSLIRIYIPIASQPTITCSKSTIEILEKDVKDIQS